MFSNLLKEILFCALSTFGGLYCSQYTPRIPSRTHSKYSVKNNEIQLCLLQCFHSNILNDVFSLLAPWCLFPFCFICLLFFSVARFSFICCKALPHLLLLSCTSNVLYCKPAVLMTDEMYTAL